MSQHATSCRSSSTRGKRRGDRRIDGPAPMLEVLEDRVLLSNTVVSQFFLNQLNKISDNSGDFLFNRAGGNTTLDVGDLLLTTFQVETLEDLGGWGGTRNFLDGSGNNEFSGFSAIEVTNISGSPGGFTVTFGPVSAAGRTAVAMN